MDAHIRVKVLKDFIYTNARGTRISLKAGREANICLSALEEQLKLGNIANIDEAKTQDQVDTQDVVDTQDQVDTNKKGNKGKKGK